MNYAEPYDHRLYIDCACYDKGHAICLEYDKDDDEVTLSYHLSRPVLWKRIWYGIKYVFGRTPRWGYFGCTIFDRNRVEQLKQFLLDIDKLKITGKVKCSK